MVTGLQLLKYALYTACNILNMQKRQKQLLRFKQEQFKSRIQFRALQYERKERFGTMFMPPTGCLENKVKTPKTPS